MSGDEDYQGRREWLAWLGDALAARPERAGLTSNEARIYAYLLIKTKLPTAREVLDIAKTFDLPHVEALRAAGYTQQADSFGDLPNPGRVLTTDYFLLPPGSVIEYGDDVDPEPENYEPTLEGVLAAIAGLGERMDRRFAAVHAKIDDVNADIDALAMTTGTLQREVRELSSRFDRHAVRVDRRFDRVDAQFGQVRADIAALKTETALVESSVEGVAETVQRHLDDPHPHVGNVGAA